MLHTTELKLKVILGSTRQGRIGRKVADWVVEEARNHTDFEVELLDLAQFNLPFLHESAHPAMQNGHYDTTEVQAWSAKVADGDAFIIVTPEYNHGYPGVLKNALDLLYAEWSGKPVGLVGYSIASSAGMAAVGQLLPVVLNLGMVPVAPPTQVGNLMGQADKIVDLTKYDARLAATLTALAQITSSLRPAREPVAA